LSYHRQPAVAGDHVGDAQLSRICPRRSEFDEPLFHTSLRAEDARRLKPDE
jgi:hypothetical protein